MDSEGKSPAQNSLELKLPSKSSPFYAKQITLSLEIKMDIKFEDAQLPAGPSL